MEHLALGHQKIVISRNRKMILKEFRRALNHNQEHLKQRQKIHNNYKINSNNRKIPNNNLKILNSSRINNNNRKFLSFVASTKEFY